MLGIIEDYKELKQRLGTLIDQSGYRNAYIADKVGRNLQEVSPEVAAKLLHPGSSHVSLPIASSQYRLGISMQVPGCRR